MTEPLEPSPSDQRDRYKRLAAERAVEFVQPGMVLGLGGGSTARYALHRLAELLREGSLSDIVGVPCAREVEDEARRLGIPLVTLDERPTIDMTIDGADEVDPQMRLIKGGGGALLREKIVAQASRRELIAVDQAKLSPRLGTRHPLPVEVVPFGWQVLRVYLEALGARVVLRLRPDGRPFRTDQANLILDCAFGPLERPEELAERLAARAGIVEHGLFIDLATDLLVGGPDGVEHRTRDRPSDVIGAMSATEGRAADGDR